MAGWGWLVACSGCHGLLEPLRRPPKKTSGFFRTSGHVSSLQDAGGCLGWQGISLETHDLHWDVLHDLHWDKTI